MATGGTTTDADGEPNDEEGSGGRSEPDQDTASAEGERVGPELTELDLSMGNFNADLPEPEGCDDFPQYGCAHITGSVGGQEVDQACSAESFALEEGVLTCRGEGFALWVALSGFVGAPPSSFNMVADTGMHVIGYSSETPRFASHEDGRYVIEQDYEQKGVRATGVRYSWLVEGESEESFVAMVFTLTFTPRPTCPTCLEVRLRGTLTAPTGPSP